MPIRAEPASCMIMLHIGEIGVDQARGGDEIGDALTHPGGGSRRPCLKALTIEVFSSAIDSEQPVVGDDDLGVDLLLELRLMPASAWARPGAAPRNRRAG